MPTFKPAYKIKRGYVITLPECNEVVINNHVDTSNGKCFIRLLSDRTLEVADDDQIQVITEVALSRDGIKAWSRVDIQASTMLEPHQEKLQ
jgi:hypothetical protein